MARPKKIQHFTLKPFLNAAGTQSWRVAGTKSDGTRVRQNFSKKSEAVQTHADLEANINSPQGTTIEVPDTKPPTSKLLLPLHFNTKLHFDTERDLHQLKSASPVNPASIPRGAKWLFDFLIPSRNLLVCTGRSFKTMRTCYRDEIDNDLRAYNFVIPGYMLSRIGMTIGDPAQGKIPRMSQHCNANKRTITPASNGKPRA